MECHRCPVNNRIADGDFRAVEFKKTPCAKCIRRDPETAQSKEGKLFVKGQSKHGHTFVRWTEGLHDVAAEVHVQMDDLTYPKALKIAIGAIIAMPTTQRNVVLEKLANPEATLVEIARRHGIKKSTVHVALERALKKHGFVRRLLRIRRQKRTMRKAGPLLEGA